METTTRNMNKGSSQHTHSSDSELSADLNKVKDSLSQTANHLSDKASDLIKDVQDKTVDIQEDTLKYVQQNPLKSLGFALIAGFFAALLIRK